MPHDTLMTRALSVRGTASTYDATARSVRAIATTESPVRVFDYDRYEYVNEILLVSGMELPGNGQVPLLDSHSRYSVDDVYGSARDFTVTDVDGVLAYEASVFFADDEKGRALEGKVRDGHLTDFSVGYLTFAAHSYYIPEGQKQIIEGRAFEGPAIIRTKWKLKELSATPIGADEAAKARSAHRANNPHQGDEPMPEELKKRQQEAALAERTRINTIRTRALSKGVDDTAINDMIERGLSVEEADAHMATLLSQRGAGGIITAADVKQREDAARLAERTRIDDIRARAASVHIDEKEIGGMIARGLSVEEAGLEIIGILEKRQAPPIGAGRFEMGADALDKFRSAAVDGLCMRAGLSLAKPAPGHESFRGRNLQRVAAEYVARCGGNIRDMNDSDFIRGVLRGRSFAGLSTFDFPQLLGDVANRVLTETYAEAAVTWNVIADVVDASDFRPKNIVDIGSFPLLDLVGENGEYKDVTFQESKQSYVIKRRGNKFHMTFEMMKNDDLGAFLRIPRMFGSATQRTINHTVYGLLASNPLMGDQKNLFDAAHKNIVTGAAAGVPSVIALSEGRRLMRRFTDFSGELALNLSPQLLVSGTKHENNIDVILASAGLPQEHMSSTVTNPWKGRLTPVIDAVLDGFDEDAWYLMPAVSSSPVIEVAFLDGEQAPKIDYEADFDSDGLTYKCRIAFGAGLVSPRIVKNPGK